MRLHKEALTADEVAPAMTGRPRFEAEAEAVVTQQRQSLADAFHKA